MIIANIFSYTDFINGIQLPIPDYGNQMFLHWGGKSGSFLRGSELRNEVSKRGCFLFAMLVSSALLPLVR